MGKILLCFYEKCPDCTVRTDMVRALRPPIRAARPSLGQVFFAPQRPRVPHRAGAPPGQFRSWQLRASAPWRWLCLITFLDFADYLELTVLLSRNDDFSFLLMLTQLCRFHALGRVSRTTVNSRISGAAQPGSDFSVSNILPRSMIFFFWQFYDR